MVGWSVEDDLHLWENQDKQTADLAEKFGRSKGGVRSRLKHLRDSSHNACKRLVAARSSTAAAKTASAAKKPTTYIIDDSPPTPASAPKTTRAAKKPITFIIDDSPAKLPPVSVPKTAPTAKKRMYIIDDSPTQLPAAKASRNASSTKSRTYIIDDSPAALPTPSASKNTPARKQPIFNVDDIPGQPCAPFVESNSTNIQPAPFASGSSFVTKKANKVFCTEKLSTKPSPTLNDEQREASNLVLSGVNVFLTGAAGVGKSFLLKHIISTLQSKLGENAVAVTASTGIAATHIQGTTIHSWAGIGLGRGAIQKIVGKVTRNREASKRWKAARCLIIDEVSMIDGKLFELLDAVGRSVRGLDREPFGGVRLVMCGDFFQLPPVSLSYSGFAFASTAWKNAQIQTFELQTIVRQQGDLDFIRALRQIRLGRCPPDVERLLATCHVSTKRRATSGIVPTKLYCTNRNVDAENNSKLAQLKAAPYKFPSKDKFKGSYGNSVQKSLLTQMEKKSPATISLKVGAQVMLTKNTPEWNLVNGSRGIVVGFDEKNRHPRVKFSDGAVHTITPFEVFQGGPGGAMVRIQFPLKLAWCWTIHKSQGMTLDRAELQLDDAFDWGQVYVALSRVTSLDGLWINGDNIGQSIVKAHPSVLEFHGQ